MNIKSPLRYPGGKSRAVKRIIRRIPNNYKEFREPMVGGGSVFFALKQLYPDRKYWINDADTELYLFWKFCKEQPNKLISEIKKFRKEYKSGKKLYRYLKYDNLKFNHLQRAARFFVLNRITYSGLVESGGYSEEAFNERFTDTSIQRIYDAAKLLKGVKITNVDYSELLNGRGKNTFVFLDPPYLSKTKSKLYGKNGSLHTTFDHSLFVGNLRKCKYRCLVTYDKCSEVVGLFKFAKSTNWKLKGWRLQYGTNNFQQKKAKIGDELFISNYKLDKELN